MENELEKFTQFMQSKFDDLEINSHYEKGYTFVNTSFSSKKFNYTIMFRYDKYYIFYYNEFKREFPKVLWVGKRDNFNEIEYFVEDNIKNPLIDENGNFKYGK